jgi:hypothetical protein
MLPRIDFGLILGYVARSAPTAKEPHLREDGRPQSYVRDSTGHEIGAGLATDHPRYCYCYGRWGWTYS